MKVTAKQFAETLAAIAGHRGWKLNKRGEIRDAEGFCPICALADEVGIEGRNSFKPIVAYPFVHDDLGLSSVEAYRIAAAADNDTTATALRKTRSALISALGLSECSPA